MAAKLILLLAFGFLVTDAYRPITFTVKRQNGIPTENPQAKEIYTTGGSVIKENQKTRPPEISITKKNLLQNMDQNELRALDFWRTLSNYLEEQPVIILSEQDVEKLEYIHDPKSEYY